MRPEAYAEMFRQNPHSLFRELQDTGSLTAPAKITGPLGPADEDAFMRRRELALRVTGLSEEEIDRAMAPMRSFLLTVRGE